MKKMKKKMTRIVKSRMSRFSRGVLEASTMLLGIWIARYWSDLQLVLKPWASILAEFRGVLYADHVRFDPCHPYIERLHRRSYIYNCGESVQCKKLARGQVANWLNLHIKMACWIGVVCMLSFVAPGACVANNGQSPSLTSIPSGSFTYSVVEHEYLKYSSSYLTLPLLQLFFTLMVLVQNLS